MARSLREGRFRSRSGSHLGEDVNPSAYIVNLADCMLVLACGFLVALVTAWNVDIKVSTIDSENLEQVEAEELDEEALESGSYYIEAGKVYQDPNTGLYYIVQDTDDVAAAGNVTENTKAISEE